MDTSMHKVSVNDLLNFESLSFEQKRSILTSEIPCIGLFIVKYPIIDGKVVMLDNVIQFIWMAGDRSWGLSERSCHFTPEELDGFTEGIFQKTTDLALAGIIQKIILSVFLVFFFGKRNKRGDLFLEEPSKYEPG